MRTIDLKQLEDFIKDYSGSSKLELSIIIEKRVLKVGVVANNNIYTFKRELATESITEVEAQILAIALELIDTKNLVN